VYLDANKKPITQLSYFNLNIKSLFKAHVKFITIKEINVTFYSNFSNYKQFLSKARTYLQT